MSLQTDTTLVFETVRAVSAWLVDKARALPKLLADFIALSVVGVDPIHND